MIGFVTCKNFMNFPVFVMCISFVTLKGKGGGGYGEQSSIEGGHAFVAIDMRTSASIRLQDGVKTMSYGDSFGSSHTNSELRRYLKASKKKNG